MKKYGKDYAKAMRTQYREQTVKSKKVYSKSDRRDNRISLSKYS